MAKIKFDKLVQEETIKRMKKKSFEKATTTASEVGHITYKHLLVMLILASGTLYYIKREMSDVEEKVLNPTYFGKSLVGGPFKLQDSSGKVVTEKDFRGKYMLLYFGFTECPDICPFELTKMRNALDVYKTKALPYIQPIFITIDPDRDMMDIMEAYAKTKGFPENIKCLTGTKENVKKAADAYRTYFSFPEPEPDGTMDPNYLIDHSIHFHLVNQKGVYITHFGRSATEEQVAKELERLVREDQALDGREM